MKTSILIVFLIMLIPILSSQSGNKSKLTCLNLAESFSKQQEVPLSRFVDKIDYIPLEINPEALISEYASFEVTHDFIFVRQFGVNGKPQILSFDRNTGKFIREIGVQGRGPGEFYMYSSVPFNPVKKELYAIGVSNDLLAYDISGKNMDRIKIPEWIDPQIPPKTDSNSKIDNQAIMITADNFLENNIFVGYIINYSGWEKRKIALFTKDRVLKVFPNYLTWKREVWKGFGVPPPGGFAKFYRWENKLNFIEAFCDTLYYVTKEALLPRYFFDWGKYNAPYSEQGEIHSSGHTFDYFYITQIDENKNNIFIQVIFGSKGYTGFVDKGTNIVTFCKIGNSGISGLKDDISGLTDVWPQEFTEKNEMVFVIQPTKLVKWLKENPDKALKARSKLTWLKNIDEFSNPVIAIGKCKD
jgi:hypothetical protein